MKIVSPLSRKRGRLEIIPLIDIMFFLLAAFMVVSISKIHVKSLKVSLPTDVPAAQKEQKEDFVSISINADGQVQLDKELLPTKDALLARLQELYAKNKEQKFLLSADRDARHGDVMGVLGRLRATGFQRVAFSIKSERNPVSIGGAASLPVSQTSAAPEAPATTPAQAPSVAPSVPSVPDAAATTAPATAPAATVPTSTAPPPAGN
jgi:biopolymer transport protein ExbD